ncbi:MAG: sigma-70 family RNA polymerase sigma factor [Bacteroidota bacterium]
MKSSTYTEEKMSHQVFETELLPHKDAIYTFACRLTGGDKSGAGDLVQDTYEKAWRFIHRYVPETNARAWLFRICHNSFINERRKAKYAVEKLDTDAVGRIQSDSEPNFAQMGDEVMNAINQLPKPQRIVLLLDLEDFSYEEIALVLKIRIGTVRSRLHRARKTLQEVLRQYAQNLGYPAADDAVLTFSTCDQ